MRTKSHEAEAKLRHRAALLELQQVLATAANEANTLQAAMQDALAVVCAYNDWQVGHVVYVRTGEPISYVPSNIWHVSDPERFAQFQQRTREAQFAPDTGLPGWVCAQRKTVWMENMAWTPTMHRSAAAEQAGLVSAVAVPVWIGHDIVAVLEFFTDRPATPDPALLSVLNFIGTQLGRVVERERAAESLRNSEQRFRSLFENASDINSIIAADGTYRYESPSAQHVLGYAPEELIGTNAFALVHPEDLPRLQQVFL